jgi:hypothetical protein
LRFLFVCFELLKQIANVEKLVDVTGDASTAQKLKELKDILPRDGIANKEQAKEVQKAAAKKGVFRNFSSFL